MGTTKDERGKAGILGLRPRESGPKPPIVFPLSSRFIEFVNEHTNVNCRTGSLHIVKVLKSYTPSLT